MSKKPLERLRHHVTGAIERGEAQVVVEKKIDEQAQPECLLCAQNSGIVVAAKWRAAQSVDRGKTMSYVFVCDGHVAGWNEGSDWKAPITKL